MRTLPSLLVLAASPLCAHVMSMSTGDITVKANQAHYELRMPLYEIADLKAPETALIGQIRFSSGGQPARLVTHECRADAPSGNYICEADYEFSSPVDRLDVECAFHKITVPNHVHLLRAQKDGKSNQAMLDFSFPKAQIRFDPPTALETARTQIGAGALRAVGGLVQILFLATLATQPAPPGASGLAKPVHPNNSAAFSGGARLIAETFPHDKGMMSSCSSQTAWRWIGDR